METQTIKNEQNTAKVTERISGSEAIVRCLIAEETKIIYGYPGTALAHSPMGCRWASNAGSAIPLALPCATIIAMSMF